MEEDDERTTSEDNVNTESDSREECELHAHGLYRLTLEQRQELRERVKLNATLIEWCSSVSIGVMVREGQWTGQEDKQLKKNMKDICEKYSIDDPRMIIFPNEYPDGKVLRKFIHEKKIFFKLGKGIHRPLYNIYARARKIFDPTNYLGRFSNEEVQRMKQLSKQMGHRWSKIGQLMGRSGSSLSDKFKISVGGIVKGSWSQEEIDRLSSIVMDLSGFNEERNVEKLFCNIPWTAVQRQMKTRNVVHCRTKWNDLVSWVAAQYQNRERVKRPWNIEDKIKLIEKIYHLDVHDEQDIDWMDLFQDFSSIPSPQKLSWHWHRLKMQYVHNHRFKSFEDVVCRLHDLILPELQRKVSKKGPNIASEVEDSNTENKQGAEDDPERNFVNVSKGDRSNEQTEWEENRLNSSSKSNQESTCDKSRYVSCKRKKVKKGDKRHKWRKQDKSFGTETEHALSNDNLGGDEAAKMQHSVQKKKRKRIKNFVKTE